VVSLVDLGAMTFEVKVKDRKIAEVKGLSAAFIMNLLSEIPELRLVFAEKRLEGDIVSSLLSQSPVMLAKLCAAGLGKKDDPDAIQECLELPAGVTALLVMGIVECTFPQGLQSFVDGLSELWGAGGGVADGPTKGAATRLPAPSTQSSEQGTPSKPPGATPPDSSAPGAK